VSLDFEWSPAKAAANARKHGVHFEEARTVFEDDEALLIPDPEHSIGEERFVLLGLSAALRVLISARKADRAERATYASRRS